MKQIGKLISIVCSIVAVLFPPYKILGEVNWGFIFDKLVKVKGIGSVGNIFDRIDYQTLIIELVIINAIGLFLIFYKTKKRRNR